MCSSDFFFMFSNFYRLDLHNKLCVASMNLQCSISKNWIEDQISHDFVMVIRNACLAIP